MFDKATHDELVQIIAQGVAQGLVSVGKAANAAVPNKPVEASVANAAAPNWPVEASVAPAVIAEDDFDELDDDAPTEAELKAQKKSEAAKKAAATRKRKADEKKAAEAEAALEAEVEADAEAEVEADDLEDDLEDEGSDAEMIEAPAMTRDEMMGTLKRLASKHPNGEKEGRKLAGVVLTRDYDVAKFGELQEQHFAAMCDSLKEDIKDL